MPANFTYEYFLEEYHVFRGIMSNIAIMTDDKKSKAATKGLFAVYSNLSDSDSEIARSLIIIAFEEFVLRESYFRALGAIPSIVSEELSRKYIRSY